MLDLVSNNEGVQIVMASSNDSRFPPRNILDGKSDTFWATTGLYPQCFVIGLSEPADVKSISISSYNVKDLRIEKSIKEDPIEFEEVLETVFESSEGAPQQKALSTSLCEARFLKFIIKSGYDHFCAVYKVSMNGTVLS
ncbi:intraflagellar transport protein 25 homolog [Parasteatoda tepidariorum]|uniref:intraflagellar transport protein 25 homolog n=1 Tax=Parasteatoda tepidariorum TaxID=114398 RepID=UPI00077FD39A|nr:intraflagellar transport protein 25 homolog [Parasteatoda tepidariorum]